MLIKYFEDLSYLYILIYTHTSKNSEICKVLYLSPERHTMELSNDFSTTRQKLSSKVMFLSAAFVTGCAGGADGRHPTRPGREMQRDVGLARLQASSTRVSFHVDKTGAGDR